LKNVVEDGKLLVAHDRARGNQPRPPEEYFIEAIGAVRTNRRKCKRRKVVKMGEALKVGFWMD
jgi:hypothetical protein